MLCCFFGLTPFFFLKQLLKERPSSVYLCASLAGMHRYKGEVKEAEEIQVKMFFLVHLFFLFFSFPCFTQLRGYELSAEYEQLHLSQGL